jgi:hypothetical protein
MINVLPSVVGKCHQFCFHASFNVEPLQAPSSDLGFHRIVPDISASSLEGDINRSSEF